MPSSSSKSKPKPSEVASEAKRYYIPHIREKYASTWNTFSYIYHQPLLQINFLERPLDLSPPMFCEYDSSSPRLLYLDTVQMSSAETRSPQH
jgi:hypothetical protein